MLTIFVDKLDGLSPISAPYMLFKVAYISTGTVDLRFTAVQGTM